MPDNRSRREKLEAMAADKGSPNEAAAARRLLDAMPPRAASPERGGPTGSRVVRVFVDDAFDKELMDELRREMARQQEDKAAWLQRRQERDEMEKFRYERPRYDPGPFDG